MNPIINRPIGPSSRPIKNQFSAERFFALATKEDAIPQITQKRKSSMSAPVGTHFSAFIKSQ